MCPRAYELGVNATRLVRAYDVIAKVNVDSQSRTKNNRTTKASLLGTISILCD